MAEYQQIARPVLFESNLDPAYPYWGRGSSVLLSTKKHTYWLTARHVLDRQHASCDDLRIFPFDGARISLPFDELAQIKCEGSEDEDYKDLILLRVNGQRFRSGCDAPLYSQRVEDGLMDAEHLPLGVNLQIVGYPAERNYVDYELKCIKNQRCGITAEYRGLSQFSHCHSAVVASGYDLKSYDGLSGSPIFYLKPGGNAFFPLIVGVAVRGTAESSLVHFISARVVRQFIAAVES